MSFNMNINRGSVISTNNNNSKNNPLAIQSSLLLNLCMSINTNSNNE